LSLTLLSSAFVHGGAIPPSLTCDGTDRSPPLAWTGAPAGTKSFALIVDDPDAPDPKAPKRVFVHWLLYNLPSGTGALAENAGKAGLPEGTRAGRNDAKDCGYCAPCPPIGRHRYFFRLYALDTVLPDLHEPGRRALEAAMQGHVLASAEVMATYQRAH
jgi:Raf kinase inhibitor-like YbhB/YbcL family protein